MQERTIKRIFLAVKTVILLVMILLVINLASRFRTWRMASTNDSMLPPYPPGTRLLLDLKPGKLRRGDFVIYRYKGKGRTARIAAFGGDKLAVMNHILLVNGISSVHRIETPGKVPHTVPPGKVFLLNDNPESVLPDSLTHGPVPIGDIWARVIMAIDFF